MKAIVELRGIGVSRGGRPVLRDLDLEIAAGTSLGISGPNGSGKTTLVRVLAGLLPIDAGTASILGQEAPGRRGRPRALSIFLIGHSPALIEEMTLVENLAHWARLGGIEIDRVMPSLRVVGLEDVANLRAERASHGTLRRVEIAHALLRRPRLLLLDEAVAGLDPPARELMRALVDRTLEAKGAAVVVSHDETHIEQLASSTLHLSNGRLVQVE